MVKKKELALKPPAKAESPQAAKIKAPARRGALRIVGIGASAGGLEAFEQFFSNMPPDKGIAFVIVQHIDPQGHSSMPEILSRFTKMPVKVAEDGMQVQPNSIYLLPPNKSMGIQKGALYLEAPARPRGLRLPIDFFFRSLAKETGADSICIILSGTGSDGTLGLRAVKAGLGTVFVQDPESARYDGMPRSAIDAGLADFVLKPAEMPEKLIRFIEHSTVSGAKSGAATEEALEPMKQIFAILRTRTSYDFSHYKQSTIRRRLERRMSVNQINDIARYARFLRDSGDEVKALLKDLLISVTNFFRDPEAFEALKKQMKEALGSKAQGSNIRAWVAGCATGEEAYSVAIIIKECLDELGQQRPVQIYGTDIDAAALRVARAGKYPANIAADVSPERLKRFFVKESNAYRVKQEIRELVVFAPQNFIKDPPFSKMDLICCRNLLIYLEVDVQKRIFPLLHYALMPGGILFLGPSESTGGAEDLFTPVDRKWKIYERQEVAVSADRLKFPASFTPGARVTAGEPAPEISGPRIPELTEKIFLDSYAPTFAVIDEKYRLVYIRGRTGKYLELASGQPSLSVLEIAREGLKPELTSAIHRAISEKKKIVHDGVRVKTNGDYQTINLTVAPLTEPGVPSGLLMVVFQEVGQPFEGVEVKASPKSRKRVGELEDELKLTRENLQATIEELEATNEELKSANEELQSNNEELQSTNEELDTSREELQSLNEELTTLNAELQDKNELLSKANDDLKNFLNRTDIAIIFLDEELRIRRYTPATSDVFNIRDIDIGRPLDEITSRLGYDKIDKDAEDVLRTLQPKETEVQRKDGAWFKMRILPYLSDRNVVSGLVLSFLDIDKQKKAADEITRANQQVEDLAKFPQEDPNPVMRVERNGTIIFSNIACSILDSFTCQAGQILPRQYQKIVARVLDTGSAELVEATGKERAFTLNFVPIAKTGYVNIYGNDITERKIAEAERNESEEHFRALSETSPVGVGVSSADGVILYTNPSYELILGFNKDELIGTNASGLYYDPGDRQRWLGAIKQNGIARDYETRLKKKDGTPIWVSINASPISYGGKQAVMGTIQDITGRKQSEGIKDEFIGLVSHELRTPLTVIIGALGTVTDQRASSEDKEALLKEASTNAETLANILDNMLELSRYQAGRVKLDRKPVRIADIAGKTADRIRKKYDTHKLILDIPADIPDITVDASKIEQVLYNLLENAVKYSPVGGEIRVFSRKEKEGIVVGVSDHGAGISADDQKKLFEPFVRLKDEGAKGVGLGLVVCKHMVEAHGGRIWVESEPGKGSTFLFSIPLDEKKESKKPTAV